MDSDKFVSVIIPCYNSGKYLAETIKNVLYQTYPNFEIIIVDDGSTDIHTQQYLSALTHPKIKVFFKENEGVSIARNIAISHSTGEYILPLDADDIISNDYLELAVAEFIRNRCLKLVTCGVETFGCKKGVVFSEEFTLERLLAKNLFVVSSLFKREDYDKTHGFNPNMKEGFEDWDFWISLLADGGEVFRINKTCFYYRLHKDSRNNLLDNERLKKLRYQIYENHSSLYLQHFMNPTDTFEYELVKNSMEYKIGKIILKPFRFIQNFRFR